MDDMDNSKLDLYLLFHDDPELLAILEDPPADAAASPAAAPTVPPQASSEDAAPPTGPPAGDSGPAPEPQAAEDAEWRSLLAELDQFVAGASGASGPEPPPPGPKEARSDPLDLDGFDGPLPLFEPFTFPDPLAGSAGEEDAAEPVVFEKASPFDEEDPLDKPPPYGHVFPYGGRDAAVEMLDNRAAMPAPAPDREQDSPPPSRGRRIAGVVFNIIFFLLCFALVAGSAVFAFSGNENKSYLGFRFFNVMSQSMTPQPDGPPGGFVKGDIIVVRVTEDPYTIGKGDIITLRQPSDSSLFLTHRVVDILSSSNGQTGLFFITKGDANNTNDPPVSSDLLVGKVVMVLPAMGKFLDAIRSHLILVIVIVIVLFAAGILLRRLLRTSAKAKRQQNLNTSERSTPT